MEVQESVGWTVCLGLCTLLVELCKVHVLDRMMGIGRARSPELLMIMCAKATPLQDVQTASHVRVCLCSASIM